jgi:hypothetical protein
MIEVDPYLSQIRDLISVYIGSQAYVDIYVKSNDFSNRQHFDFTFYTYVEKSLVESLIGLDTPIKIKSLFSHLCSIMRESDIYIKDASIRNDGDLISTRIVMSGDMKHALSTIKTYLLNKVKTSFDKEFTVALEDEIATSKYNSNNG